MKSAQCSQWKSIARSWSMLLTILFSTWIMAQPVQAAPGDLDQTFGSSGIVTTNLSGGEDIAFDVVVQPDGKIVVAGRPSGGCALARYSADGSLDPTFGSGGLASTSLPGTCWALSLQSDGKIVVAGDSFLARFTSAGVLDTASFGAGSGAVSLGFSYGRDVAIQPSDSKIVVAGYTGSLDFAVSRYNSDGSPDGSFGSGGTVTTDFGGTDFVESVVLQSDGKIVVAGGSSMDVSVARYNPDGSLDSTFSGDGKVTTDLGNPYDWDYATDVVIQADGKVVVAAQYGQSYAAIVRYNSDGSLDPAFDTDGIVISDLAGVYFGCNCSSSAWALALQADGKIVLGGSAYSSGIGNHFAVARYNSNGSFDSSFGTGGVVATYIGESNIIYGLTIQTDGKIVAVGRGGPFYDNNFALVRYLGDPIVPPVASLVSIGVTPTNLTINIGQTQQFTATGTFSDGSMRVLSSGGDIWTTKSSMPTARGQLAASVINDVVYAVGGFFSDPSYITHATLEAYNPLTDTWTTKTPMPTPRYALGAGVVNGILYAVGGIGSSGYLLGTVEAYDPVTNTWTTKAYLPTYNRSDMGIGVVGGVLYAVGGYGGGGALASLEAYDPVTDTWTTKTPMPTARIGPAVGVVNGILYAVGGDSGSGSLTVVEAYDPITDTWTTMAPMPTARCCMGSGVINGILYAVGGFVHGSGNYLTTVEAYDPVTNTWTTKPPVPANMFGNAVGVANSVLYSVGGFNREGAPSYGVNTLNTVYAFAPGEVTWSSSDGSIATVDPIGLATGLSPGTTTITATSGSISGNTTLRVNAPPVANADTDQTVEATFSMGAMVTLDGSASSDADGDTLSFSWSGCFGTATGATPTVTIPLGVCDITLTVTDSHGATSTDTVQITVRDSTAPSGTITIAGGEAWTKTSSVTLTLSCTDGASGCSQMQFSNDNITYTALQAYATSKAWTLVSGNGTKTVYVRYTDAAGNTSSSVSDTITLDTSKPVVSAVSDSPDPFRPSKGQSTTIQFTLSDNLSGECTVKVRILNSSGMLVNTLNSSASCPATGASGSVAWNGRNGAGTIVPNGTYTYRIQGSDQALNQSVTQSGDVRVR